MHRTVVTPALALPGSHLGPLLRGVELISPSDFNPSRCSIKCSVHYVLEPVVTHAPGCPSAPAAVTDTTGSIPIETGTSTTKEAPIANH
jgi:hypothetical protein